MSYQNNVTPEAKDKVYGEVQKKMINLMLQHTSITQELIDRGVTPEYFDQRYRPVVQAIYYVHGQSKGKCLLTSDHYRTILVERGVKGDITIAMEVYHECSFGVHFSNTPDDFGLLLRQIEDAFLHRQQVEALKEFNEQLPKIGRAAAIDAYQKRLAALTAFVRHGDGPLAVKLDPKNRKPLQWLWQGHIPLGKLTIIQGDAGKGKSQITVDLAARVASGTNMPFSSMATEQGDVILANAEDDTDDTIIARFENTGLLTTQEHWDRIQVLNLDRKFLDISKDIDALIKLCDDAANPRLIILDPLSAYLGSTRTHEDSQVRSALAKLCLFANQRKIAVIGLMHLNKDKSKGLLQRSLGSTAFGATARSVFMVGKDKEDRLLFSHIKSNLSKLAGSREFEIESIDVENYRIRWLDNLILDDPTDLFVQAQPIDGAKEWLEEQLQFGPVESAHLFKTAEAAGFPKRTVERAKKEIGAQSRKRSGSTWECWEMYLPDVENKSQVTKKAEVFDW